MESEKSGLNRRINRRFFLKAGLVSLAGGRVAARDHDKIPHVGCLVDTTLCIGCRKCEEVCHRRNKLPGATPSASDRGVFKQRRRPTIEAFTVVNRFPGPRGDTYCKVQCMHCLSPACVSACVVGAMSKAPDGSVVYNKSICLGCHYCMIACPFEIPAYEFADPLLPRVRKCEFCTGYKRGNPKNHKKTAGANPACASACPTEALVFGVRKHLLDLARHRIRQRPDRYIDRVYGEKESGGTAWLYLMGRPPEEIGLPGLPQRSPAELTETIQHGVYKYGLIPIAVYGILALTMWWNKRGDKK